MRVCRFRTPARDPPITTWLPAVLATMIEPGTAVLATWVLRAYGYVVPLTELALRSGSVPPPTETARPTELIVFPSST